MTHELRLIIVDDEPVNVILLEEIAKEMGHFPLSFLNPENALEWAKENLVDLIIVDFNMPVMNGLDLLKAMRISHPDIMSIMITANADNALKLEALGMGVNDFLTKPISTAEFQLRLTNMIHIKNSMKSQKEFARQLTLEVEKATEGLKKSQFEALEVLSKTAEYKDPETGSHIARVSHYSKMLAAQYGLDEKEQEILFYAAPLHDIGKVGIEDAVLLKPGKLIDEEFDQMKLHSTIGYNILKNSTNPYLIAGSIVAQSHHEKYNGLGYPNGLVGDEIPLYARIVAIADVFDALTSIRPYKRAWSFEEAMALIEKEKGEHFDPHLANLFIANIDRVREIYQQFEGMEDEC
ncbi:MAG TPA: HD domain-containing phosphohydrolase [Sulfuricurvum sp.]|nr:HD domain-containing phosphohydrolase [Sulfuricurvum sp.]